MEGAQVPEEMIYHRLRQNYLIVYLLATFVDWLQGPYLYSIYANSNYTINDICVFYITGFASSAIFGILVGHLADRFGRKRLCVIYFLLTIATCLCTISKSHEILLLGRVFGGICTSILFSTFESWYIGQHISRYNLDKNLIGTTFAKATFYNGLTAIFGGFISSILVDSLECGPTGPFLLSIPISTIGVYLCSTLWAENIKVTAKSKFSDVFKALKVIFSKDYYFLIYLGIVQMIFETVMYIFVFLWTPVLEPIEPSYGFIFGIFMICIVIGSSLYSTLVNYLIISREALLCLSVTLGLVSITISTAGIHLQMQTGNLPETYLCLVSFLFFELAVGMYFPAVSYLRGVIVPESLRAGVANWLRLPSNILIVIVLFYIKVGDTDNRLIFALSAAGLGISVFYSAKFVKTFSSDFVTKCNSCKQSCSTLNA